MSTITPELQKQDLAFFKFLQTINMRNDDALLGKELREKYEVLVTEDADKHMPAFLEAQLREYFEIVSGRHELSADKSKTTEHQTSAHWGAHAIIDSASDPKQCARFLEAAFYVASLPDTHPGQLETYAMMVLNKPVQDMGRHLGHVNGDSHALPLGARLLRDLKHDAILEEVHARSPSVVQALAHQAVKSHGDTMARLRAVQIVEGLPEPSFTMPQDYDAREAHKYFKDGAAGLAEGLWQEVAVEVDEHTHKASAVQKLLDKNLHLPKQIDLAKYACAELIENDPSCDGALALLAKVQKNNGHKIQRRAEDSAMAAFYGFQDLGAVAAEQNDPDLMKATAKKIKNVLATLEQPQVGFSNAVRDQIGTQKWQFIMKEADDADFNKVVGRFLFDLAANPEPVHDCDKDSPAHDGTQNFFHQKLQEQFTTFYSAADEEARGDLKKHAAKRIAALPKEDLLPEEKLRRGEICFQMIENGRTIYKQNSFTPTWLINIADMATEQPHEEAYNRLRRIPEAPVAG